MARSALVVRGGWQGHQPIETTDLFIPFLRDNGFAVRVENDPAVYRDADGMGDVDLIVQSVTMSEISSEACHGLRRAVERGAGLIGWHGGIVDSYRASADYLQLVGGQFAAHPSKEPAGGAPDGTENFLTHRIEMTELGRAHPITAGIDDFELVTEQYWVLHDDLNDVLATTAHPAPPWHPWARPVTSPAIWTRRWGQGRIVVVAPGHSVEVLGNADVRTVVERGMLWASRAEAPSV